MTTQLIGNVLVVELKPEDKLKNVTEQIFERYVAQVQENALLRLELERIKEQQKLMQFAWQG
jgi:hypothetical protein